MNDEDFVYVADLFVRHLNTKVELMVNALVANDYERLFELGHWLKGASGSAGYGILSEPGLTLETAAKANDLDVCLETMREICRIASRVRVEPELQPEYSDSPGANITPHLIVPIDSGSAV